MTLAFKSDKEKPPPVKEGGPLLQISSAPAQQPSCSMSGGNVNWLILSRGEFGIFRNWDDDSERFEIVRSDNKVIAGFKNLSEAIQGMVELAWEVG